MAKLRNRIRRFVVDGRPAALGVVAIGDAHTCTNPLYGRGCSLGMVHAELLADAVAEHDAFDDAFHLAFEAATAREIEPWYTASVMQDRAQRAEAHRLLLESRGEAPEPSTTRTRSRCSASSCARCSAKGLLPALRTDATVFRAFLRGFNLLVVPERADAGHRGDGQGPRGLPVPRRARARPAARPRPRPSSSSCIGIGAGPALPGGAVSRRRRRG